MRAASSQSRLTMLRVYVALFLTSAGFVGAGPLSKEPSFIGKGTNQLATALLQSHLSQNENLVFAPLGMSAVLATFAEGAKGDSRQEIATALQFPDDVQLVRQGYQAVLQRLSEKYKKNIPEMKNWFYVYKNYTVDEGLKDVLKEYYLTEVKSVDRPDDFIKYKPSGDSKVKVPAGLQGKPTDHLIDVDKEVESIIDTASSPHKSDGEEANSVQEALFDNTKVQEDKQESELPGSANTHEKTQISEDEKNELKKGEVTEVVVDKEVHEKPVEGEKKEDVKEEVNTIPVETEKKDEVMVAMQRSIENTDQLNSITDSAFKIKRNNSESQMVVFNGFYYQGEWNTKFVKMPADNDRPFYKSNDEPVYVQTLHAEDVFQTAEIPELKSRALELKYEGDRYSLLLIIPQQRNGLNQLVQDLVDYPVSKIYDQLEEKPLDICVPTFCVTTISKPLTASKKSSLLNVKSIFNPELADLTGISKENGLYVEELVQLVTFRVDSNFTEANFLTASIASSRSDSEKVRVNQPFLFYLRDNEDGIIVVNGQIVDPTPIDDDFTTTSLKNTVHHAID